MKLFRVDIIDDCESETVIVASDNKENAEEIVRKMDWSCLIFCVAMEIKEVDGYKIRLEK